jgi:secondary thiamine-phosphate synthase enzyme
VAELTIQTRKKREIVDITDEIHHLLKGKKAKSDLVHLFVLHTTAALMTADLDPGLPGQGGTEQDYLDAFEQIVPRLDYRHPHDPSHMPDHILSSLIGTSLTLPVEDGKLVLGTWQRVTLVELDGPRKRRVVVSFS